MKLPAHSLLRICFLLVAGLTLQSSAFGKTPPRKDPRIQQTKHRGK